MKAITTTSMLLLVLPLLTLLNSCATIMHGTRQSIGIASNPSDASVWVDQAFTGKTPLITEMSRGDNHVARIELDGYHPYELTFVKHVSGWVFGNLAFGGIIGLAVDAVTGGLYSLTPEQIQSELRSNHLAYSKKSNDSYIVIVLEVDPSWKKVGNLVARN